MSERGEVVNQTSTFLRLDRSGRFCRLNDVQEEVLFFDEWFKKRDSISDETMLVFIKKKGFSAKAGTRLMRHVEPFSPSGRLVERFSKEMVRLVSAGTFVTETCVFGEGINADSAEKVLARCSGDWDGCASSGEENPLVLAWKKKRCFLSIVSSMSSSAKESAWKESSPFLPTPIRYAEGKNHDKDVLHALSELCFSMMGKGSRRVL